LAPYAGQPDQFIFSKSWLRLVPYAGQPAQVGGQSFSLECMPNLFCQSAKVDGIFYFLECFPHLVPDASQLVKVVELSAGFSSVTCSLNL